MYKEEYLVYEIDIRKNYDNITDEGWEIVTAALLKQVPTKPVEKKITLTQRHKYCHQCNKEFEVPWYKQKYCSNCGQAINWN